MYRKNESRSARKYQFFTIGVFFLLTFSMCYPAIQILNTEANGITIESQPKKEFKNIQLPLASAPKEWCVMLYKDADNNLEDYVYPDFNELEKGLTNGANINAYVMMDIASTQQTAIYNVTHDTNETRISSQKIEIYPELNMGNKTTLRDFIDYCVTATPANHYWLDLWNHGANYIGICFDDTSKKADEAVDHLSMADITWALQNSLLADRLVGGRELEILTMDACLMGSIEVAYEMNKTCQYLVASPETIPATGFPYDTLMEYLVANPTTTISNLGKAIVDEFFDYYSVAEGRARSETLTSYDMDKLAPLMTTLNDMADCFVDYLDLTSDTRKINDAWWICESYTSYEWIDLGHFLELIQLSWEPGDIYHVYNNATATLAAYHEFVNYTKHNAGHENCTGLSISFPLINASIRAEYLPLSFRAASTWDEFINHYFSKGGGGTLSYRSLSVDDSLKGNNNDIIDSGEDNLKLNVTLYNGGVVNFGPLAIYNITLSCASPYVEINDATAQLRAPCNVGQITYTIDDLSINVTSEALTGSLLSFKMLINTTLGNYYEGFVVSVGSITVTQGDSFENATLITFPNTIRGYLPGPGKKGELYLAMNITEQQAPFDLMAILTHGVSPVDFDMDLFNDAYQLLASGFTLSSPETIEKFCSAAGMYYLVLYPFNSTNNENNKGNFTLSLTSSPGSFKRGENFYSAIFFQQERFSGYLPGPSPFGSTFYRVYFEDSEDYNITLSGQAGTDFDIFIYDYNGYEVAFSNNPGSDEWAMIWCNYTGDYYIEIWRYSGEGTFQIYIPGYGVQLDFPPWVIFVIIAVAIVAFIILNKLGILGQCCTQCCQSSGGAAPNAGGPVHTKPDVGSPAHYRPSPKPVVVTKPKLCKNCKARLGAGQTKCPKCGTMN